MMKDWHMWAVAVCFTAAAGCVFAAMLHGCGPSHQEIESAYEAAGKACLDKSRYPTKASSDRCTDRVDREFNMVGVKP